MTHLYIEQNGITEEVSSSVISKLYQLASSGTLDGTSNLKGRLHSTTARDIHVAYLNEHFQDLYISVDALYLTFVDPEVERVLATKYGDGTNVTSTNMASVTSINYDTGFNMNTTVTSFPELGSFTSIVNVNTLAFNFASNLTTIDLSNIQHIGGDALRGSGISGIVNLTNIVSIGDSSRSRSFDSCSNITKVNIGPSFNNDTQYMLSAFGNCTSLQEVTGLSNITSVAEAMFNNCTSLTDVDIDWTKITSIGKMAFRYTSISGNITLSSLSSIDGNYENGAFRGCTGLTSVDLTGSTITSLSGTFRDCTNLSSVTLPDTLTSLESDTFQGCSSLQTIDLKNVTYLKEWEFRDSGLTSIDLSNIQHIGGSDIFYGCTNLTTVTFPSTPFNWFDDNYNTTYQNKRSFLRQCTSLTSIDLSNALSLSISMFYNDTSLTTVTLSASNITTIPEEFCLGCTKLSSLGEKIKPTTIGDRAFQDCNSLNSNTYLDLSEVTYIGNSALKGTTITGSVNLPECLELGEAPFHENPGITEIHCPKLTTINRYTVWQNFANLEVLDLPVTDRLNSVQNNPKLTTINAPLATKFSTYDDGKLYLGNNPRLSILNINFSLVTKIGDWCFDKDAGLNGQYLEFPNVTEIGAQAFGSNAINFVLSNNTMVTYSDYGAPFTNYTGTVYVPDALLSTYRADSIWSQLPSSQMKGLSELPQS